MSWLQDWNALCSNNNNNKNLIQEWLLAFYTQRANFPGNPFYQVIKQQLNEKYEM